MLRNRQIKINRFFKNPTFYPLNRLDFNWIRVLLTRRVKINRYTSDQLQFCHFRACECPLDFDINKAGITPNWL